jgi:hypothetical protein
MPYVPGKSAHPKRTKAGQQATRQAAVRREQVGKRYVLVLKTGIARLDVCIVEAEQLLADLRAQREIEVKALKAEEAARGERKKPCSSASWK